MKKNKVKRFKNREKVEGFGEIGGSSVEKIQKAERKRGIWSNRRKFWGKGPKRGGRVKGFGAKRESSGEKVQKGVRKRKKLERKEEVP